MIRNSWKEHFPALNQTVYGQPLVYLDSAATTLKPQCVIDAIVDYYAHCGGTVHRAVYSQAARASDAYHLARESVARFIGADTDEVIFTRGTTESINLIAQSFAAMILEKNDEIMICEIEHHANLVPWQMVAQKTGAKLISFPVNDLGEIDLDVFEQRMGPRTKIIAFAHLSNVIGVLHPVEKMIQIARRYGAYIVVDGAQAAAHLPIDVKEMDADFYVFSGHKCYGPTGVGVLYGKKHLLDQMPPLFGGGDMIDTVQFEKSTYALPPARFEAGTPMIAQVIGLAEAIHFLEQMNRAEVCALEDELIKLMSDELQTIERVKMIGMGAPHRGCISFIVQGIHHLDVGTLLDLKGVAVRTGHLCAQPAMKRFGIEGLIRFSVGLYTSPKDIEIAVGALRQVIKSLVV